MELEKIKKGLKEDPLNKKLHQRLAEYYRTNNKANQALIEEEILSENQNISSLFRGLGIALTSRCYLECIMCEAWRANWDIPASLAEELKEYIPRLEKIYWQGGEVFCSEYFEELFDKSLENPLLRQELVTSGLYITESMAEKFAASRLDLILSIDGATRKTYEKIRKGASFEKLKNNLAILKKYREKAKDMTLSINYVVMKSNYLEIPKMLEFAAGFGVEHIMLTPIDHTESEENIFYHRDPKAADYLKNNMLKIHQRAEELSIYLDNFIPPIEVELSEEAGTAENKSDESGESEAPAASDLKSKKIFCYKPWEYMYIDIGGVVRPDCFCRVAVGDVNKESLMDIWNGEGMRNYRSRMLSGDYEGFCNRICYECENSGGCISGFPPLNSD